MTTRNLAPVPPPEDVDGPIDPPPAVSEYERTWQPVDLTDVLDGHWTPLQPTIGARSDGVGMFYPGKAHTVSSESEAGKTWFALAAARDELERGNSVIYLDFEDDAGPLVSRLLTLGINRDLIRAQFHYLRPEGPVGTGINRDDLQTLLSRHAPTLGIIDGVTEAMTLHGLDPLSNTDAAKFGRMLPRALTQAGAACVSLDHVPKSTENRGRYSIGAVHKLNALDGAAYTLENRHAFGIGITGRSGIKLAKDRPGQLRRHALPSSGGLHWFGDLVLESHAEGFSELTIEPPADHDDDFRPTTLMARVSTALAGSPEPLPLRGILDRVTGKAESTRRAIACLVDDGYVTTAPGPRGATLHTLVKPYPEGED